MSDKKKLKSQATIAAATPTKASLKSQSNVVTNAEKDAHISSNGSALKPETKGSENRKRSSRENPGKIEENIPTSAAKKQKVNAKTKSNANTKSNPSLPISTNTSTAKFTIAQSLVIKTPKYSALPSATTGSGSLDIPKTFELASFDPKISFASLDPSDELWFFQLPTDFKLNTLDGNVLPFPKKSKFPEKPSIISTVEDGSHAYEISESLPVECEQFVNFWPDDHHNESNLVPGKPFSRIFHVQKKFSSEFSNLSKNDIKQSSDGVVYLANETAVISRPKVAQPSLPLQRFLPIGFGTTSKLTPSTAQEARMEIDEVQPSKSPKSKSKSTKRKLDEEPIKEKESKSKSTKLEKESKKESKSKKGSAEENLDEEKHSKKKEKSKDSAKSEKSDKKEKKKAKK